MKILLAEDDPVDRALVRSIATLLEAAGYVAVTAESLLEAPW
ncbi:MAG: response regulator transcription factor [Acidimicrobiia bacterium]|nr:response regulator transcription factor [Acidimicrobiia bacterium]